MDLSTQLADIAVEMLNSRDRDARLALHDSFAKSSERHYICSEIGANIVVTDSRDPIIGRGLFVDGLFADYNHFDWIVPRVREHRSFPETLIDIGANIGPICIPAISSGLFQSAIAIEANPQNCRLLRANIALNGLQDSIRVVEAAAGREAGFLEMEIAKENPGDHRIHVQSGSGAFDESSREKIHVKSIKLDDLLLGMNPNDLFIWMDVQGYEGHVMDGSSLLLSKKPILFLEIWPYGLSRANALDGIFANLQHYSGFFDARSPSVFRGIEQLGLVCENIAAPDQYTDILLV